MTIPVEQLDKWMRLKSHGDGKAIAEKAGVNEQTVSYALKVGRANDELYAIMANYFQDKEQRFSDYLSDYQD